MRARARNTFAAQSPSSGRLGDVRTAGGPVTGPPQEGGHRGRKALARGDDGEPGAARPGRGPSGGEPPATGLRARQRRRADPLPLSGRRRPEPDPPSGCVRPGADDHARAGPVDDRRPAGPGLPKSRPSGSGRSLRRPDAQRGPVLPRSLTTGAGRSCRGADHQVLAGPAGGLTPSAGGPCEDLTPSVGRPCRGADHQVRAGRAVRRSPGRRGVALRSPVRVRAAIPTERRSHRHFSRCRGRGSAEPPSGRTDRRRWVRTGPIFGEEKDRCSLG